MWVLITVFLYDGFRVWLIAIRGDWAGDLMDVNLLVGHMIADLIVAIWLDGLVFPVVVKSMTRVVSIYLRGASVMLIEV